jgi:hypothetical protein
MFTHVENLKVDLENIFSSGDWCPNVPKFQTRPTLFTRQESYWQALKEDFINEATLYVGKAPKFVEAWCYANFPNHPQDEWPLFHDHLKPRKQGKCVVCGVMYLSQEEHGTLFQNKNEYVYAPSDVGVWVFFDADVPHSPPYWDASKKSARYCIAANALY